MFRSSLRRCATQARTATTAALLSQTRAALPVVRSQALTTRLPIASINKIASFRAYSSEAAAEQTQPAAADAEPEVRFADLEGVDQSLIRTIIQNMGYETMTPVQAKTIKPALKGTDM
jgi:ATP-dependent RNA helicase MSS116